MKLTVVTEAPLARVGELEAEDLVWPYHDRDPYWKTSPALEGNWGRQEKVDPFPCYRHDAKLVVELLRECVAAAPLGDVPVTVFVAPWEGLARTNAWATYDFTHQDGERRWEGLIALSGRRTEIHPAVTRYVVAHEYGHVVEQRLAMLRYPGEANGSSKLLADFARVRGLRTDLPYGGMTHHLVPNEVFANDFRSHVVGREPEFWPHPVRPAWQLKRVQRWWDKAIAELAAAAADVKAAA